jgi:signal transduction histidine kinase
VSGVRVAIVDDTPDLRLLLRMALERGPGIEVVAEGGNGQEGVDIAARHRPDVILLDLAMPVMDGMTALPLIREQSPETAVVVLSGFAADAMTEQAIEAGARSYLQKGATVDELRDAVLRHAPSAAGEQPTTTAMLSRGRESSVGAEREVERLRQAIAHTAHELRNPVTVLTGVASTMDDERITVDVDRRRRLLEAIRRQAGILERLTDDLLAAAQTHRGSLRLDVRPFSLGQVISTCISDVFEGADQVSLAGTPDVEVRADPGRVTQMLVNLLSNAKKYGAPPVSVVVSRASERQGDVVRVAVIDHGPGVPEEFCDRLFGEYERAGVPGVAGAGLGLFVVRSLAEAHDGRVDYAAGQEGGSVFTLTLPLVAGRLSQQGRPDSV